MSDEELPTHEDMGRWARLPKWAQQELEHWRKDVAFWREQAVANQHELGAALRRVRRLKSRLKRVSTK